MVYSMFGAANFDVYSPGDANQIAVGQVYANATLELMESGTESGRMFWSLSVHDPRHLSKELTLI